MKAKTFSQFILENLNIEEVDGLLGWLSDAPFYPLIYSPLWASDFTGIRAQLEERLMQYPDLERLLHLGEIYIHQGGTDQDRNWYISAEWEFHPEVWEEGVDTDELTHNLPTSIIRLPLEEIEDEEDLISALDQMQQAVLNKMALDESLGEDWLEQVVELGDSGAIQRLCKNPVTPAEILLQAVKKIPEVRQFAETNPNWPNDVTDWALGDW